MGFFYFFWNFSSHKQVLTAQRKQVHQQQPIISRLRLLTCDLHLLFPPLQLLLLSWWTLRWDVQSDSVLSSQWPPALPLEPWRQSSTLQRLPLIFEDAIRKNERFQKRKA